MTPSAGETNDDINVSKVPAATSWPKRVLFQRHGQYEPLIAWVGLQIISSLSNPETAQSRPSHDTPPGFCLRWQLAQRCCIMQNLSFSERSWSQSQGQDRLMTLVLRSQSLLQSASQAHILSRAQEGPNAPDQDHSRLPETPAESCIGAGWP